MPLVESVCVLAGNVFLFKNITVLLVCSTRTRNTDEITAPRQNPEGRIYIADYLTVLLNLIGDAWKKFLASILGAVFLDIWEHLS